MIQQIQIITRQLSETSHWSSSKIFSKWNALSQTATNTSNSLPDYPVSVLRCANSSSRVELLAGWWNSSLMNSLRIRSSSVTCLWSTQSLRSSQTLASLLRLTESNWTSSRKTSRISAWDSLRKVHRGTSTCLKQFKTVSEHSNGVRR